MERTGADRVGTLMRSGIAKMRASVNRKLPCLHAHNCDVIALGRLSADVFEC